MASLWGGRFEKDMDDIVKKYNASIFFDQRMYNEDIDGSIAHVTMLGKQGIESKGKRSDHRRSGRNPQGDCGRKDPVYRRRRRHPYGHREPPD